MHLPDSAMDEPWKLPQWIAPNHFPDAGEMVAPEPDARRLAREAAAEIGGEED